MLLTASPLWANEIDLSSNTSISNEGYFVLSWSESSAVNSANNTNHVLLQSNNADMRDTTRYSIPAKGSITLSGFSDGTWYFQIDAGSTQSNVIKIEVIHHLLNKALLFFVVGMLLFLTLCLTIFWGHKTQTPASGDRP